MVAETSSCAGSPRHLAGFRGAFPLLKGLFARRISLGFGFGQHFLGLRDLVGTRGTDACEQIVDRLVERGIARDRGTLLGDLLRDLFGDHDRDNFLDDYLLDHHDDLGLRFRFRCGRREDADALRLVLVDGGGR